MVSAARQRAGNMWQCNLVYQRGHRLPTCTSAAQLPRLLNNATACTPASQALLLVPPRRGLLSAGAEQSANAKRLG